MIKTKDGAKVIQLVPAPLKQRETGDGMEGDSLLLVGLYPDDYTVTNNDVLYLAVMDDGSIRPVGKIASANAEHAGELAFLDEPDPHPGPIQVRLGVG